MNRDKGASVWKSKIRIMQASLWEKLESKYKGSNSIFLNDFVPPYDIKYLYWHSDVIEVAKSVSYFANTYHVFDPFLTSSTPSTAGVRPTEEKD